jgi:hypothetical protein
MEIADQLADAESTLADALERAPEARGSREHQEAAELVRAAREEVLKKQQALDRCRGCADPITAQYVDLHVGRFSCSDSRIGTFRPIFSGSPAKNGSKTLTGWSFKLSGCDQQFVSPDPKFPDYIGDPFGTTLIVVPRRFPDVFVPTFPFVTFAPYAFGLSSVVRFRIESGRYDRATGHVDLVCSVRFAWLPSGGPPSWFNGLYGLDFSTSTFHGLMTTRSVPTEVPPLGLAISGEPRKPGGANFTLVCSGRLSGGFGDGRGIEFVLSGSWSGQQPVGP